MTHYSTVIRKTITVIQCRWGIHGSCLLNMTGLECTVCSGDCGLCENFVKNSIYRTYIRLIIFVPNTEKFLKMMFHPQIRNFHNTSMACANQKDDTLDGNCTCISILEQLYYIMPFTLRICQIY